MSRRSTLSEEDRVLWNLVARSTTPLKGRRAEPEPALVAVAEAEPARPPETATGPSAAPARTAPVQPPRQKVVQALDRQTHDKLAKGRLPIEGRVDLHGLTQDEAYKLLLSFLRRAQAAGGRYVLVITGKGSTGDGVLRRNVPHWLATPPFRAVVSGHDGAARGHGGGGALYVRLRRP